MDLLWIQYTCVLLLVEMFFMTYQPYSTSGKQSFTDSIASIVLKLFYFKIINYLPHNDKLCEKLNKMIDFSKNVWKDRPVPWKCFT